MKTPTPDFTKDTVTLDDIVDWLNQGFKVHTSITLKANIRYGAYWNGEEIVVYEMREVKAQWKNINAS